MNPSLRRVGSTIACLGLLATGALAQMTVDDRPHIIFIMFDDLGYGGISAFLDDPNSPYRIETPNLDALAANGLKFTQYYANASVCSPTRSSVLSGLYPADLGIRGIVNITLPSFPRKGIPETVEVLPQVLQDAGYYTAHVGKWHVGGNPYGEFEPTTKGYDFTAIKGAGDYSDSPLIVNGNTMPSSGRHLTRRLVDTAIKQVEEANLLGKKLFMNLWFFAPHADFCDVPSGDSFLPPSTSGQTPVPPGDPTTFDTEFEYHARLVNNADYQISRLIDRLEALQMIDDTLIIVTSDNGGYLIEPDSLDLNDPNACKGVRGQHITNDRFWNGKSSAFEGGIRVPMIAHWPRNITNHAEVDQPLMTFDLFPTLASVANASPLPDGLRGTSFADILINQSTPTAADRPLVWEHKSKKFPRLAAWAVRSGDFKLVHNGFGLVEAFRYKLFDLEDDPGELIDLLSNAPPGLDVNALRDERIEIYRDWRIDTGRVDTRAFDIEGDAAIGFGPADELEVVLNGNASNGGRLLLAANPRIDLSHDDFTFRAWVQPRAGTLGNGLDQTIVHKEGSWTLRVDAQDRLSLTVSPVDCIGDPNDDHMAGCGQPPQTLEIDQALEVDRWYHVAFTVFQELSKGMGSKPAEIKLYLRSYDGVVDEVVEPSVGLAPPTATMNRVSLGAIDAVTEAFSGRIYDPEFFQARLDADQIEDLAGMPVELDTCPAFQNRNVWAASPVPLNSVPFGSEWETLTNQGRSTACCNPAIQCNDNDSCVARGTVPGTDDGTVCARPVMPGPSSFFSCVPAREGQTVDDVNNNRFCCQGGAFVPFAGSTCQ